MIGPLVLRLMLAWRRHADRRDLAVQLRDAEAGL
jgi:hypothetical protein